MTLEQAMERNPYNPDKGNLGAYLRYLRYNVDGWYEKTAEELKPIIKKILGVEK